MRRSIPYKLAAIFRATWLRRIARVAMRWNLRGTCQFGAGEKRILLKINSDETKSLNLTGYQSSIFLFSLMNETSRVALWSICISWKYPFCWLPRTWYHTISQQLLIRLCYFAYNLEMHSTLKSSEDCSALTISLCFHMDGPHRRLLPLSLETSQLTLTSVSALSSRYSGSKQSQRKNYIGVLDRWR